MTRGADARGFPEQDDAVINAWRFGAAQSFWMFAAAVSGLIFIYGTDRLPGWTLKYPRQWNLPLKSWIGASMDWLLEDASLGFFTFQEFTRGLAWLLEWPLEAANSLLSSGLMLGQGSAAVQILPPLSWVAVLFVVLAMGRCARDWGLATLVGGCFLYLAVFGQWQSAMVTLSSIVIAVPIGVAGGTIAGIAGYRWPVVERVITPILDLMQTIPIFAYLVPILFLFGFGPVAAMLGTIVYATPPMVRVTMLALRGVPPEIVEFGHMAGCTRRQLIWKVLVPYSRPSLMVGVNQVIMLSLNMVIIASMIGAGGLGYDVLTALRRLDIGGGVEAGLAIVVLAVALDRLSQAYARREPLAHKSTPKTVFQRYPWTLTCILIAVGTGLAGVAVPAMQRYPESWLITTGSWWGDLVAWINVNFYDDLESIKTLIVLNVLVPVKRFMLAMPWAWVTALLSIAGWQLGGARLGALVLGLCGFIVVTGQWPKAVISVYLCGLSVIIASAIGISVGLTAALRPRVWQAVRVCIDTLQTLPSFVYLIPVVMLFRVGDFSAMIAIVAYSLAPAIRYTVHGIQKIDPQLIEAGIVSGCTPRQLLTKIRLPLAMPEIMLGINQTVMLALSMLVITALVGTRDLGQEVYIALTKADPGRGLVAGLSVAFIAIIADRMIAAGARRMRRRLGLALGQEQQP